MPRYKKKSHIGRRNRKTAVSQADRQEPVDRQPIDRPELMGHDGAEQVNCESAVDSLVMGSREEYDVEPVNQRALLEHNYVDLVNQESPVDGMEMGNGSRETNVEQADEEQVNQKVVMEPNYVDGLEQNYVDGSMVDDSYIDVANVVSITTTDSEYQDLRDSLACNLHPKYTLKQSSTDIQILEFYELNDKSVVKCKVSINEDFKVKLQVHHIYIPEDHDVFYGVPTALRTVKEVNNFLYRLAEYNICIGNPEEEFQELVPVGSGITERTNEVAGYREGDFCASYNAFVYHSTIRSVRCSLLIKRNRCKECCTFRGCLQGRKRTVDKNKGSTRNFVHSTYKHKDMSRDMLIKKINQQKDEIKCLESDVWKLKRECDRQIKENGVRLDKVQDVEMTDLMSCCERDIIEAFPDANCYQRLFWEQQRKFHASGKNGMRWHPMIVRWCLYIRQKSAKAYDSLRDSGFIKLPSSRTLFDYSHYTKSATGFQADVTQMLQSEAGKKGLYNSSEEWRSYVGVLFDEVRIKEDLVYDKHSGELIGFCDLGDVGNQILELEKVTNTSSSKVARFMLVLMVRGVVTDLRFPFAGFATMSITADFLYPIIWKAVSILENINLKVLFLTCDGASANRKFFNMHKVSDDQNLVYNTANPHDVSRKIFFISDVPHLLKTARNCFSNSFSHKKTRRLWKDGRDISWLHIVNLFEQHCELELYNPCPKLTRNHVDLTAFSIMKVNLAAQVMSETVGNALEDLNDDSYLETINFIRKFNKFFDCLNVRHLYEGRNKRNPDLNPYRSSDDGRLQWLKSDFLGYLNDWETSVVNRAGNFTAAQKSGMKLSHQTIDGLKISVHSITECVEILLQHGAPYVLTHHFNQDPLEQHFGHLRNKCGSNNNPTVFEARSSMTQLRTVGVQALAPKRGNVERGQVQPMAIDDSPLPKRKSMN